MSTQKISRIALTFVFFIFAGIGGGGSDLPGEFTFIRLDITYLVASGPAFNMFI